MSADPVDPPAPSGYAGTRLALALLRAVSRLPLRPLRALGRAVGTLLWWVAAPRRRITLINLRLCFPEMTDAQRRRIGCDHFRWFACSILERFILWHGPPQRIRAMVRIENPEALDAFAGRPVIVLAPHFVGMDAGGLRLTMDRPMFTMYQRQKNPVFDAAMRAGRARFDGIVLLRNDGVRGAVRRLREGLPFYYLPDIDLGARDAVFVPFFGVPAATVSAPARLVAMTGATVLPFVTLMTRDGYVGRFFPPWHDFPAGDPPEAIRRMNEFIEARVREAPEQYLWSHKRFKTRPPGAPSPYSD